MPVSIDRRTVSTLCAPLGGLRPGATKLAALLRRLWAPGAGVQACGPAPLTAQAPKCLAAPGAPVGWDSRSIRMHKPGGRRGNRRNRGFRTPEREGRSATERGVHRGFAPYAHSLGTFSCARESTSSAGTRPGNLEGLPESSGRRKHPRRRERGNRLRKQVVFMGNCSHFATTFPPRYDILYL